MAGAALSVAQSAIKVCQNWASSALASAQGAIGGVSDVGFVESHNFTFTGEQFTDFEALVSTPPTPPSIGSAPEVGGTFIPERPTKPDISSISLGTLYSIVLPDLPSINFPSLDIEAPVYSLTPPQQWNFNIGDILITDDPLVQAIKNKLTSNINEGGTGLSADVEAAIWDRDLERNEQQLIDSTTKVTSMWAKKGFSLPDGDLAHSLSEIQKEYLNRKIDRSREIAIKQADLEQTNLFKSLEIATDLTGKLISMLIAYEDLVFRGQEATARFANEYIDLQIKTYMSMVEAYRATAQVHETMVRAEIAKVELYKAQIEAQKVVNEINELTIKAYAEQVQATLVYIERYKAEVQAMVGEVEAAKVIVEANKVQVDAWAKSADVEIAIYNGGIEQFKAESQIKISTAELKTGQAETRLRINVAQQELVLREFELTERLAIADAQVKASAAAGIASAAGSMAAGAMAAASAHASLSYEERMDLDEGSQ